MICQITVAVKYLEFILIDDFFPDPHQETDTAKDLAPDLLIGGRPHF